MLNGIYGDHIVLFVDETGFNDHNCVRKRWVLPEQEEILKSKILDSNLGALTMVTAMGINSIENYMIIDKPINQITFMYFLWKTINKYKKDPETATKSIIIFMDNLRSHHT